MVVKNKLNIILFFSRTYSILCFDFIKIQHMRAYGEQNVRYFFAALPYVAAFKNCYTPETVAGPFRHAADLCDAIRLVRMTILLRINSVHGLILSK